MTDTDETRRRRSEAARKAAAAKSPGAPRETVRKGAETKGPECRGGPACK